MKRDRPIGSKYNNPRKREHEWKRQESRNEILRISRRDRKHDKKEIQVPENKEISNSYVMSIIIWNRYQIDVVNTYACNVAVDENEDHEPSIEKCTQREW